MNATIAKGFLEELPIKNNWHRAEMSSAVRACFSEWREFDHRNINEIMAANYRESSAKDAEFQEIYARQDAELKAFLTLKAGL